MSYYERPSKAGNNTVDSVYSKYADMYSAWDVESTRRCPDCRGTGLDRDEIYDCETCFGEGYLPEIDLL